MPLPECRPPQPPGAPRTGGEWRLKYERAVREIDFTKKRLQQELEDKLEVEQQSKRQLERRVSAALPRDPPPPQFFTPSCPPHGPEHPACPCAQLADLQADSEEGQRALQQLKKKCQRLASELQDTKLHLEGQQGRNHDLEKKQRRWGGAGTGTGWWHPPPGGSGSLSQRGFTILAGIWALHQLPLGRGASHGEDEAPFSLGCGVGGARGWGAPSPRGGPRCPPKGPGLSEPPVGLCPVALLRARSLPVSSPSPKVC